MRPRIAIPVPHSGDSAYAERALPQYERAVEMAGGEPVRIPMDRTPVEVMKLIERCDAVLLPGSKADVDPGKYGALKDPATAAADTRRDSVDQLLLQDAYNLRKPVLGICYGLQTLNVYLSGTLLQHIDSPVNHEAGRKVPIAHSVEVDPLSRLAEILTTGAEAPRFSDEMAQLNSWPPESRAPQSQREDSVSGRLGSEGPARDNLALDENTGGHGFSRAATETGDEGALAPEVLVLPVNSSHHQSAQVIGNGLRAVAHSAQDGIIEAVEGTSPDHFVLAVQWHPERSVDDDEASRAIFRALVNAARERHARLAGEFEPH